MWCHFSWTWWLFVFCSDANPLFHPSWFLPFPPDTSRRTENTIKRDLYFEKFLCNFLFAPVFLVAERSVCPSKVEAMCIFPEAPSTWMESHQTETQSSPKVPQTVSRQLLHLADRRCATCQKWRCSTSLERGHQICESFITEPWQRLLNWHGLA